MTTSAHDAIQQMTLYTDEELYRFVRLPAQRVTAAAGVLAEIGAPFAALIVDKDEVSLFLTDADLTDFAKRLGDTSVSAHTYRLITFDLVLEEGMVGFMARISRALADADVSIMPFAAFSRDHVLVPAEQFDAAWAALQALRATP
jgi:hypothetical protein